ncbi:CPBP family intramembrane glutamic endopeptidase [Micromonospora sp. KC723]|uniref:CPBP family intramembrane glutamic endopeptidase n=1 Tax=Micromonospora sp. KC723 TaxID=2530381 RepID=UPI001404A568|nr:CPBP family intramembrane glutamic endopeptidase [Micromonospora sp. KC723]
MRHTSRAARAIARRPMTWFFVLAFAPAWAYELICVIVFRLPLMPWMIAAPFLGPTAAAFVVTHAVEGREGVRRLLRDLIRWRVAARWYLLALVGVPALLTVCVLPLPGALSALDPQPAAIPTWLVLYAVVLVVGGPLGEEPGWRCFATPRLQDRFGPTVGTFVLAVLWALWHLPLSLIEGYNHAGAGLGGIIRPFLIFLAFVICVSYLFTWVFNRTQGSGPIAILLHTPLNVSLLPVLFPTVPDSLRYQVWQVVGFGVVAVVLLVLTRGRLSLASARHRGAEERALAKRC